MKPANCWGQAAPLLEALEDSGAVGHAYLLLGPANSAKEDAAWLIAQTAICPAGRCGACEDCLKIARHNHPDVHFVSPQSAQGYLVGQIRDLIDDIQLAPIRGKRKVYVLDDAQCLTASSANALLKNLEEPPEDTVFVLLATTSDAVLPTVASRCQTLQFPALSPADAVLQLARSCGAEQAECRRILAFCPDLKRARAILESDARKEARTCALEVLSSVPRCDELDLMKAAARLVEASKGHIAEVEARQAQEMEDVEGLVGNAGLKELEERHKRERAACERSGIIDCLSAQRAFLRDCIKTCMNPEGTIDCDDFAAEVSRLAGLLRIDGSVRAIEIVSLAMRRIETNVTPRMAVEAMLLELKETCPCQP